MSRSYRRRARRDDEREDVASRDGKILFNHLQQSIDDEDDDCGPDRIVTDPWGITTTSREEAF